MGANLLLIGISSASIAPYRAIVAIDNLGISNSVYAVIMTVTSVATALVSLVLGYFSDRIPDRRHLVVACALLGALAYGLIGLYPTQLTYIVIVLASNLLRLIVKLRSCFSKTSQF